MLDCEPLRVCYLQPLGLGALLLIGFAPVAWIFSQSTDSVAFMGCAAHRSVGDRNYVWFAFA